MLKVSCDSSKEMEFERVFFCTDAGGVAWTEPGFLSRPAGREHFGGVCEIGDCRSDIINDRSYTILVPEMEEKVVREIT